MKRITYIVLLSILAPVVAHAAGSSRPPSSVAIYETLEDLWSNRKYSELNTYVDELKRSWNTYVPVQLTLAIYSYKYGAQVEDTIGRLKAIRDKLNADIAASSPVFMELLDGRILRYEKTEQFYKESGITREDRMEQRNPLNKTAFKHSKHWVGVDEMLYFNAPEVFLTEQGIAPANPVEEATSDSKLKEKDAQDLLQSVGDDKESMCTRKAAVKELIRKRREEGSFKQLARGLNEANMVYTYRDTVEALTAAGSDAVPTVLEALNDPAASNTDKKYAIWALVRIGVATPDVMQTLRAMAEGSNRTGVADYAERALEYLQRADRVAPGNLPKA